MGNILKAMQTQWGRVSGKFSDLITEVMYEEAFVLVDTTRRCFDHV